MTPMQVQANNVLNALNEGQVLAVITLYDDGSLYSIDNRHNDIRHILTNNLKFSGEEADYWLDFFHV